MTIKIRKFIDDDLEIILEISQLAFEPIYESFQKILDTDIYKILYPK